MNNVHMKGFSRFYFCEPQDLEIFSVDPGHSLSSVSFSQVLNRKAAVIVVKSAFS